MRALLTTVFLAACAAPAPIDHAALHPAGGAECDGKTAWLYAPESKELNAFPDDFWSEDTPAGLRLAIRPDDNVRLPRAAVSFRQAFVDLNTLDGFGVTAGMELMFSGPLDPASLPAPDATPSWSDSVLLFALDAPGDPIAVDLKLVDDPGDQVMIVSPRAPLSPRTRYGLAVTRAVLAADGGCVRQSNTLRQLLAGRGATPALQRLHARYSALLARSGFHPVDLSAAIVFTTASTVDDSVVIADFIGHAPPPIAKGTCAAPASGEAFRRCEATYVADDFRVDHRAIDPADPLGHRTPYTVPVSVYLPASGAAPYPTILFGHGLSGTRKNADILARVVAPEGYAVVAIDAVMHGEHPTHRSTGVFTLLDFFALNPSGEDKLDGLQLRDNWRQATFDKLQLIEALRAGFDVDGDGGSDFDGNRLSYYGISLGGIMGAELLALSPHLEAAVLNVPGARVSNIIQDGAMFAVVIQAFRGTASDGEVARFFPVLQTLLDRGDSGAYARHVVSERLPIAAARTPRVLMQMVIDDEVVPNTSNRFFARGLGLPQVGAVLQAMPPLAIDSLPIAGGGVYQFDVVCEGACPGRTVKASHGNTAANPVAVRQAVHFMKTGEIIDSYRVLGVKP
ncbi:MAG: hypothetical protein IT381_00455 [Deltaproteobacteria bacterium]|nr:hypothetical protein [Deltaproteobacteria bacterium]